MMLAQQLTDGCANHFRDAFSELALLQQQGMFCDITLFICEDIVATNVSRQATTDPDAAANTDSSTHDRPTGGNTEQATSGSIEAPVTSTELAQIQEFQNQREVNATPNPDSIALKHQLYQHDRTKTVGEERISFVRAHKVVLAACSKVLLSQMMQDLNATEMLVGATSHAALSAIIHYMYSGVLNLTPDSVEDIHERCRAWDMQMAVDMCEQFQKQIEQTVVRQVEIAATQQTTQQTETPPKRTRGRPPSSKSAAAVKEFVRTPRTRSASLRSASPMAVKEAPKKRGRKKDETKLIEEPVTEVADSRTGLSEAKHASGNVSLGNVSERDLGEKDVPDNDAEEEFLAEGVEVEREKVEEKSHAYSLRPEIKRRQDPDDATPAKTRKVCRNIVLENVLVIKGTRARKNVHYTKTPAEIGHIQKHGYHADYLDLSLFSDTSGKTKSEMFKSKSEVVPEGTGSKENSLAEKGPGAASIGCAQEGSSDVAGVGQMFLKDDNKRLQDTAIPEEVDSKKLGDKDHNYVVAQNDSLKQKGKQHGCRTCRRCHKRFRTKLQYHSHLDKCPVALACPRKHYHCRQCNVSFATHTEYHKHRRMHLEMSKLHKPYMCNQCDFKCRVETRLVEHMYRQHGFPLENSGFEVYVCSVEGCGYQSILRNVMKHHQTRHSQERPFMCEFCGMKFKSKVTLRTHTRIHTNERMFKCTYCDASYIQRVGLLNHIKSKHERTNEFLCSQCPFVTSLKPNLQNHMFTAHGILPSDKAKVYKCEHCGLKTLRKSEYTNHMRRHSGVKSFACDVCSHKFYTQAEINNHKKRHLNNPPKHTCPYESCNFAVFEKSKLQQHIRIRHTEKGLKPWTCYICDYRTDLKGNLTKHLRTVHHLVVQTNQKLCKVVSSTVATSSGQMLTPTTCVNVNDLHVSKMAQPVDELPRHPPPSDPIDVAVVPGGYLKVKECDIETVCVSPSIESQQHGLLVGGDINQVPVALMPDISRPLDTSNMRVIYSMTNLAGTSSGMPGDGSTDLVVMSSGVSNLPVSSLTNMSMSSPSLGTTTMPLTSLTPLPSISSSLGGLRHSSLALSLTASLPATSPVNVPYPQSLGGVPVTSNSDLMPLTTTTLTPLVTHIPPPTPHILPPAPAHMPATGQGQLPKDGSLGMLPILMPTDPNSGLYMYADNQLIPPQAMSWEHASQDITQYRQQAYK